MAEMGEAISVSANIFDEYVPIDMVQLSQQRDALERELRMAKGRKRICQIRISS